MNRRIALAMATAALPALAAIAQEPFRESVAVTRVLLDVRVVDHAGHPVLGLGRDSFRVAVDGVNVAIEDVEWVGEDAAAQIASEPADREATAGMDVVRAPARGRLIVMLFQKDFYRTRLSGLMRMKEKAIALLDQLGPLDRVAVLSHDSHLRFWLDFTADRDRLREVIGRSILFAADATPAQAHEPSLAAGFDADAARLAASPEAALRVIGDALAPLPGPKSLVLIGWGLGRLSWPRVEMGRDWEPAREALARARTTVFALDITDADAHTLEAGLITAAEQTGGFYARTHLFPDEAMARLERALAGHYVLVLEPPPGHGRHEVHVTLAHGDDEVLARTLIVN